MGVDIGGTLREDLADGYVTEVAILRDYRIE
jgi:hypothetical protein